MKAATEQALLFLSPASGGLFASNFFREIPLPLKLSGRQCVMQGVNVEGEVL